MSDGSSPGLVKRLVLGAFGLLLAVIAIQSALDVLGRIWWQMLIVVVVAAVIVVLFIWLKSRIQRW